MLTLGTEVIVKYSFLNRPCYALILFSNVGDYAFMNIENKTIRHL